MTEKKTFKNQRVAWQYEPMMRKYGWCVEDEPCFFAEDWDMEVTFTKKVNPEVGGTATLENYSTIFTIIAVSDGRVWLQGPNNQAQNFVRRFDQLRNVEPWRPA